MKRSLCLWSICAVLGLFGAGCGDDSSDSGAEVPAMTCKDKKAGDKCNADGTKTCQAVEGKKDLECKDKPTASEDPCKGKNAGDKCNADGTKTCQKVEGKEGLQCENKPAASEDPCKGKNEGENCKEDGSKTCQKVEGKEGLQCENKPAASEDPCKGKNEGDKCNADGTKTCQKVEGKEGLQCEEKPTTSEDPCKGKNEGDKCNADGTKTCQKVEGKEGLQCEEKPAASEDPCKGKNEGENCKEDGTKTCQKVEGKEGLQCEDKPVEIDDPCKGKNAGDNCKEDGSMTCQAVEGKKDLECKDAVVDPNKCTPGITRCATGNSQGVELCLAGGTWGPMTACQEENEVQTMCFKVGENKAECHRPCAESAKEGDNATCQQTGDAHESEVTVCAKAIGGELYVVEKKVYPCHSACTDGKCDFVNFCLNAADSNGGPSCVVLNGMGYYGVCEGNKVLYPEESWACADANPVIGYGCPAGLTTCGCSNDSECPAGKTCVLPDAKGHGNFCKGPND